MQHLYQLDDRTVDEAAIRRSLFEVCKWPYWGFTYYVKDREKFERAREAIWRVPICDTTH